MNHAFRVFALVILLSALPLVPEAAFGEEARSQKDSSDFNPGTWIISFYRDHISAVDGDRCPSFPSCSSYSAEAFRTHGFLLGWMMTVDRLIHEGGEETAVSPLVYTQGGWKIYDPLENNDSWWYRREKKDHDP